MPSVTMLKFSLYERKKKPHWTQKLKDTWISELTNKATVFYWNTHEPMREKQQNGKKEKKMEWNKKNKINSSNVVYSGYRLWISVCIRH